MALARALSGGGIGAPSGGIVRPGNRAADDAAPLVGAPLGVNACEAAPSCVTEWAMDDARLAAALERSERAILRIERAASNRRPAPNPGDDQLRAKVREAVAELDSLIREAAH